MFLLKKVKYGIMQQNPHYAIIKANCIFCKTSEYENQWISSFKVEENVSVKTWVTLSEVSWPNQSEKDLKKKENRNAKELKE